MNIQLAVASDSAVEYQGRLCILGTLDTIETNVLPVVRPHCSIVYQIVWSRIEEGSHSIRVDFLDEDGRPTMKKIESSIMVSVPPDRFFVTTNHIVNIQQLKFNKAGTYIIAVVVDGTQGAEIRLQVLHLKQNA